MDMLSIIYECTVSVLTFLHVFDLISKMFHHLIKEAAPLRTPSSSSFSTARPPSGLFTFFQLVNSTEGESKTMKKFYCEAKSRRERGWGRGKN
jgi:hypothetical protein